MNPELSIVIPTKNRPYELSMAVESALALQARLDIEVIISSNGNSQNYDLSNLHPEMREKVKVVRSLDRLSLPQNWRYGLTFARGAWILILGDDDLIVLESHFDLSGLLTNARTNGIRFRALNFTWVGGKPHFRSEINARGTSAVSIEAITKSWDTKWWTISPHRYPTGSGNSIVRRSWMYGNGPNAVYQSLSPDWYTGAMYAFTEKEFTFVDTPLTAIGNHPLSSISMMKNPNSDAARIEVELGKTDGNTQLLSLYHGIFPTTWLVRIDALVQARHILEGVTSLPLNEIVKNSYITTPRFVFKVYKAQKRAVPEFGWRHEIWLLYYFAKSILKKLLNSIK